MWQASRRRGPTTGDVGYMQLKTGGPEYWIQPLRSAGRLVPVNLDRRFVRRVKLSPDGKWLAGNFYGTR